MGGSGGGNLLTRRLCRTRRRDDNELYRSNSFKFERFERKDVNGTLSKQVRGFIYVFEFNRKTRMSVNDDKVLLQ